MKNIPHQQYVDEALRLHRETSLSGRTSPARYNNTSYIESYAAK